MYRPILYILLFLLPAGLEAQALKDVITKICAQYSAAKPLQFSSTYNLYKDSRSTTVFQSYKGAFYKNAANEVYLKINETEFYNTKKLNAKISHSEKAILLTPQENKDLNQEYDINKLFEVYDKGYFKDKKTYWEIELKGKTYSGLPFARIVLFVGKDYFIQKQVFYYSAGINFSKDYRKPDMHCPRLEVIFGKPTRKPASAAVFDTGKYFSFSGAKVKVTERLREYELIDKRSQ